MDVLINAFRTEVGDPLKKGGVRYCADLTSLGGSTVRVRFAQVDNQMRLLAQVDAVQVTESMPKKPGVKDDICCKT